MINIVMTGSRGDVGTQLIKEIDTKKFNLYHWPDRPADNEKFVLIHLAARHPTHSVRLQVDSNLIFLIQLLEQCGSDVIKCVFISSSSVYGKQLNGSVSESYIGAEIDSYGMTKLLGEKLLETYSFPSLCLRCPAVLELKNSNNLLSKLHDKLVKGDDVNLANADQPFNTFVDAGGIWRVSCQFIASSTQENMSLNVAYHPKLTLYEIVNLIAKTIQSKSKIIKQDCKMDFYTLDVEKLYRVYPAEESGVVSVLKNWSKQRLNILD